MNFFKVLLGNKYPQYKTNVIANNGEVAVVVTIELSPNHVDLDKPDYLTKKLKKVIPALSGITVSETIREGQFNVGPKIMVTMSIKPHFNTIEDIETLTSMAHAIANIAEDRLSEPKVIKNIGDDCKPWFNDREDETTA